MAASPEALQADSIANVLVQQALAGDARLATPDSTYAEGAEILANGSLRRDPPRFAGIGIGGSVQIGATRIAVTGGFVWGLIEYRWMPPDPNDPVTVGEATVVIGRDRTGAWRILHLHSSTPPAPVAPRPAAPDTLGRAGLSSSRARGNQAAEEELPRMVSRMR